ncbi:MAG TPA: Blp family class II bacteriocin [Burkholderiales bacterium]|nr:Blp family class II bacteriocin [Burkholderiales bacterium]
MKQLSPTRLADVAGGRYDAGECLDDVTAGAILGAVPLATAGAYFFGGWGLAIGGVAGGVGGAYLEYENSPNCRDDE